MTVASVGYFELLRRRPAFRNLWLGEVVSLAGDWFSLIALYSLLLEHTGSGEMVGGMLAMRFLPTAVFGPVSGVVADRLPRKWILVACDVLRALTVLGFLLVRSREQVWLVYGLVFLQMSLTAFFEPAEQAAIGTAVAPDEVVAANTLAGATWSAMLSVGAVAGGLVVSLVGRDAASLVDAASYGVSALLISRAAIPRVERRLGGDDPAWLQRAITVSFCVTGVFYALFALSPTLPLAALALAIAHTGVSTQWVFSTSLISLQVAPELRGRVFSVDFTLYMLVMAVSAWGTGAVLDRFDVPPRTVMLAMGGLLVVPLALWLWLGRPRAPLKTAASES